MIVAEPERPDLPVSGAAITKDEARITVQGVPDKPGTSLEIFSRIAAKNISVDMIVQNVGESGKADISFTVPQNELRAALEAVREAANRSSAPKAITSDDSVAKVSVVGLGMAKQTGVAQKMFRSLADAGINIQMITTSEIKISVLVSRDRSQRGAADRASGVRAGQQPPRAARRPARATRATANGTRCRRRRRPAAKHEHGGPDDRRRVARQLAGPRHDQRRARQAGHRGQGVRGRGRSRRLRRYDRAEPSFAGRRGHAQLHGAAEPAHQERRGRPAHRPVARLQAASASSPIIAKLSVSGVGLRTHTGVAIRMFKALAEAGINLEMINTSEVRVNVVVDGLAGEKGLKQLQAAFADVLR